MTAALALLVLFVPVEMPPPVFLPDLLAFSGCTRDCAVANKNLTQEHRNRTVQGFEDWCRSAWEQRQDHVWCAWSRLADALDEQRPTFRRAESLKILRDIIGDEAYYAGRMPDPTPGYLYPPLAPKK